MDLMNSLWFISEAWRDEFVVASFWFVGWLTFFQLIKRVVIRRISKIAPKTETTIDDFIVKLASIWDNKVMVVLAFYLATKMVDVSAGINILFTRLISVVLAIYTVITIQAFISYWIDHSATKDDSSEHARPSIAPGVLNFIKILSHMALWLVTGLLLLNNWGLNVTALIGGLGLGGLAIAFAVQNVLGDVFASISILFDKPFRIGDWVEFGEQSGTVQKIGLKTTRIRSLDGNELVVSNRKITDQPLENYGRLRERYKITKIILDPETSQTKLKHFPELIQAVLKEQKMIRPGHAVLRTINLKGYVFEFSYTVLSPDFQVYLSTTHDLLLALNQVARDHHIKLQFAKDLYAQSE